MASASFGHVAFANAPLKSLRPVARGGTSNSGLRPAARPKPASVDGLINTAKLGGAVGYVVADVKSGKVLEARGANKPLPPASTAKAITALYALGALGPKYRFTTRLMTNGSIAGGVVSGDLILVGGGDPTLDTDALAGLAAQLKRLGIKSVRGRFLYHDTQLPYIAEIDKEQPDHVGYNPSVSGLNLNYNRVHFEWRRTGNGYAVSMDARSKKYRPDVTAARMKIANRNVPVYKYQNAGTHDAWSVAKGALGKSGARWLPIRKPGLYAAEVFQTFARAQGIVLKAPKQTNRIPQSRALATHNSAPLSTILRDMLKYSTNLTAEIVGLAATRKRGGNPGTLKASAQQMSNWARGNLGMKSAKFVDHSGLGSTSDVSPADMVSALQTARRIKGYSALLKPIAMRDAKRKIIKNHPITVRAKTGTLNFVSALSGYMIAPDGRELAFSIICADTNRRRRLTGAEKEAPQGGRAWNKRAKVLQQKLIERWGAVYG